MAGKKGQKINKETSKRFWKYYADFHPEWTQEQCEAEAKKFRKSCNYNSKEYYIVNYPDLTDKEREVIRQERIMEMKKNNKSKIEYYQTHYPDLSPEEQYTMWHNFNCSRNAQSITFYERKYPELSHEEHLKMLEEYKKKYLAKRKSWTGANNCNSKENTSEQQRRGRSPRCIEFYQRKYPDKTAEEQEQMLKDYFEKNRLKIKNSIKDTNLEYYLNQGMSEDEAKLTLKERQSTFSLKRCIEKYGEEKGIKVFNERQKKWNKNLHKNFLEEGDGRSFQSKFANTIIDEICKYLNIEIPKKEKYISNGEYNFAYDFAFGKKIIEFQGDYWHCNPDKYSADYYSARLQCTAQDIWNKDKRKLQCAEQHGYTVLYIWEAEFQNDKHETIKKCIEFLINETIDY